MSARILAHARAQLAQQDIAHAVAQRTAQPLRRAGLHARMALLACLHVLECEQPQGCDVASDGPVACSTALLWHSLQGPQAETEALLAAQREGDQRAQWDHAGVDGERGHVAVGRLPRRRLRSLQAPRALGRPDRVG